MFELWSWREFLLLLFLVLEFLLCSSKKTPYSLVIFLMVSEMSLSIFFAHCIYACQLSWIFLHFDLRYIHLHLRVVLFHVSERSPRLCLKVP
jgi:hypothetical protein